MPSHPPTHACIHEDSDRIRQVKSLVRARASALEETPAALPAPLAADDWKTRPLAHPDRTIRLATAFSGIGAVEHAFQRLRLNHALVFAGDVDEKCRRSYFANYKLNPADWFSDIRAFDATPYRGRVDFLVGGAPCQAFSMVGRRLGFEDARGTLFYEFARLIRETEPKVFLFENVRGLLSHDSGRTWCVMRDIFAELGYDIHFRVLNSRDYGIPQNRERLFCLGFRTPTPFAFPKPIPLEYRMYDFLEDAHGAPDVAEKYYLSEKVAKYVLAGGTKNFRTSTKTDLDVARPLLQSMHKMHRAGVDNYVTHRGRIRKLTPRECLRLMGFRDSFKIVVADTPLYRQAGNSIVVDVLIAILRQMDITQYGEPIPSQEHVA